MKKKGEGERRHLKEVKQSKTDPLAEAFFKGQLKEGDSCVMQQGTKVYARMQPFVVLDGLQVIRQGVLCGEIVKKRFEPHQHFYTAGIHQAKLSHVYEMSLSECEQSARFCVPVLSGLSAGIWQRGRKLDQKPLSERIAYQ